MRKRNLKTVRAYSKWYYEHKLKGKHPKKWHISKMKWVRCPFCNSTHWYMPLRLYDPEVFGMLYGGRGCIKKFSERDMVADGLGSIVYGVKDNYMRDLKDMAVKFLRLYCSVDELKRLFSDLAVTVTVGVPAGLSGVYGGYSGVSGIPSNIYGGRSGVSNFYNSGGRINKKPSMAVKPLSLAVKPMTMAAKPVMEGVKTTWVK